MTTGADPLPCYQGLFNKILALPPLSWPPTYTPASFPRSILSITLYVSNPLLNGADQGVILSPADNSK